MTIYVLDSIGLEAVTILPQTDAQPDFQGITNQQSVNFAWGAVSDDLRLVEGNDRAVVETMWTGLVQLFSSELLASMFYDGNRSLLNAPLFLHQKWANFELERELDMEAFDDELTLVMNGVAGASVTFAADTEDDANLYQFVQGALPVYVEVPLRTRQRLDGAFRMSGTLDVSAPDEDSESWVFAGVCEEGVQFNGLFFGLSSRGNAALLRRSDTGTTMTSIASGLSGEVSYSVTYEFDGIEVISVTASDSTTTATESFFFDEQVAQVACRAVRFFAPPAGLADALGLNAEPGPIVTRIGLTRVLDVSVPSSVQAIPTIQSNPAQDDDFLVFGIDFDLGTTSDSTYIRFIDQPPDYVWAESVFIDEELIYKRWGQLTGIPHLLEQESSELNRGRIAAILYSLTSGPSIGPLATAVAALSGAPMAVRPGTVVSLYDQFGHPAIVVQEATRRRTYRYANGLSPTVEVGQSVSPFQIMTDSAQVYDWVSGPQRVVDSLTDNEIQKYASLFVEIPVGPGADTEGLEERVLAFLRIALPVWVGIQQVAIAFLLRLTDTLNITDSLEYEAIFTFKDGLTSTEPAFYDDPRNFKYDDGLVYNDDDYFTLQDILQLEVTNTSGSPITLNIFGNAQIIGGGGILLASESEEDFSPEYFVIDPGTLDLFAYEAYGAYFFSFGPGGFLP